MNQERSDERAAKMILEEIVGVQLEHADTNGGVDYVSVDGTHAVEVTRVTDGRRRAARGALRMSVGPEPHDGVLETCWVAFVPDTTSAPLKTFRRNVHRQFVELERTGERHFESGRATAHVLEKGPLSHLYLPLLRAGVETASAVEGHRHRLHAHKVIVSLGSGGSSSGSDEALVLLIEALGEREDNPRKLRESGAKHRHLFVWLDDDTRFDIVRPLSLEAPSWDIGGFGLPSFMPNLHSAITNLWVVHEGSRRGWAWNGEEWRDLREL